MKNLRELNIEKTIQDIEKATTRDNLIISTIHSIEEITKCINRLTVCLREGYSLYAPSTAKLEDSQEFLEKIKQRKREEMGIEMTKKDLDNIISIADSIKNLEILKQKQIIYLESIMKEICPLLSEVATPLIAARLISHTGSLKKLAELPSSTVQVLGAEKALFRHIKNKSSPPKFGIIFSHPAITNSENKGKAARQLASKISIAAKKDYFRENGN